MRRRRFLRTAGGAAAAAGLGLGHGCRDSGRDRESAGESSPPPGSELRWTWVHGGADRTSQGWRDQFARLAEAGFSGVLVGGGPEESLAEAAHAAGLEFHRWIWTLNRNGDAGVRENHPEWFTVSRNLESSLESPPYVDYYRWLCPTRTEVREYLKAFILDIARRPHIDGIHLDYIRHCDVILPKGLWSKYRLVQDREYPEFDFCYCEICRDEYATLTGLDPLDLPDPSADERWRRFRWDSVTGLVNGLAKAVHAVPESEGGAGRPVRDGIRGSVLRPHAPGKAISAAVFPTPDIARRLVRQAWDEWPLDAFFPMLYHEFYEEGLDWIGRSVREGLAALGPRGQAGGTATRDPAVRTDAAERGSSEDGQTARPSLFAGLYLPTLNRDGNRQEAVELATGAGADGVCFFEMNGLGI